MTEDSTQAKKKRKEYYEKNKEHIKSKSRQYYLDNKEKVKKRQELYANENPDLMKEQRSRSNKKHRDKRNERAREYNRDHRDEQRAACKRNYYKDLARQMVNNAKQRARRKNLPFNLNIDDINIPTHCPILGMKLVWGEGIRDDSPSLDRIVPELGYIRTNVAVVSNIANKLKRNATLEQLELVCVYLKERI